MCLTDDERDDGPDVRVPADRRRGSRGRGRPRAREIQRRRAGCRNLAAADRDVLVTGPQYRSAAEVFVRAAHLLEAFGVDFRATFVRPPAVDVAGAGCVRYAPPDEAASLPDGPDVVIVDEAAALPVRRLEQFLDAPAVTFATTVHGYEGAGRGFSVRFRDRLAESDLAVTDVSMTTPIRYSDADPVEVWAFRSLLLDARPPVDQLPRRRDAGDRGVPTAVGADLLADTHLLRDSVRPARAALTGRNPRTWPDTDTVNLTVRARNRAPVVSAIYGIRLSASTRATCTKADAFAGICSQTCYRHNSGTKPPGFRSASESSASQPTLRSGPVDSAPNSSRKSERRSRTWTISASDTARRLNYSPFGTTTATRPSISRRRGTRPAASTPT